MRSYCVQYRESDLDFISRLLAEEGIGYRFEGADPLRRRRNHRHSIACSSPQMPPAFFSISIANAWH